MLQDFQKSPWKTMWTSPKETLRFIVQGNVKKGLIALAVIATMSHYFTFARYYFTEVNISFILTTVFVIILSPFIGMFFFYFYGWILSFTGKWLGGQATRSALTAVVAWASIPQLIILIANILAVLFIPSAFFSLIENGGSFLSFVQSVGVIWSFILFLLALSEVQGFGFWKTIGNFFLLVIMITITAIVIGVLSKVTIQISMKP